MKTYRELALLTSSLLLGFVVSALADSAFPDVIALPAGWGPEGIATGSGTEVFVGAGQGSPVAGGVYKGDLRTGAGGVLVPPQPDRFALGLKLDPRSDLLFVAGGPGGGRYVYDATDGSDVAVFQFGSAPTFVNDVI